MLMGLFKQFTTDNSGMPFNHATYCLGDSNEKILWIATDRAGLVRFDLKDNWKTITMKTQPSHFLHFYHDI